MSTHHKNTNLGLVAGLLCVVVGGSVVFAYQSLTADPAAVTELTASDRSVEPGSMMHQPQAGDARAGHRAMMQQMLVTSERAFIEHMIPHHQEAIDTANEVLARGGTTPEIRELMQNIIEAQTAEIESMRAWYESWYGTPYQPMGTYTPMMRELDGLSGAELDRVFLEDMIMHHMGAIMMARSVQPYIEHQEIADLTQAIVTTQSAEIVQMRQLLQVI